MFPIYQKFLFFFVLVGLLTSQVLASDTNENSEIQSNDNQERDRNAKPITKDNVFEIAEEIFLTDNKMHPQLTEVLKTLEQIGTVTAKAYLATFSTQYNIGEKISGKTFFELTQKFHQKNPNNALILNNLAYCYEHGMGVKQDFQKAVELYEKAVKLGDSSAMYNLAYCYENGTGVEKNLQKAVELYFRAYEKNHKNAKTRLIDFHKYFLSSAQKAKEGYALFAQACEKNPDEIFIRNMLKCAEMMEEETLSAIISHSFIFKESTLSEEHNGIKTHLESDKLTQTEKQYLHLCATLFKVQLKGGEGQFTDIRELTKSYGKSFVSCLEVEKFDENCPISVDYFREFHESSVIFLNNCALKKEGPRPKSNPYYPRSLGQQFMCQLDTLFIPTIKIKDKQKEEIEPLFETCLQTERCFVPISQAVFNAYPCAQYPIKKDVRSIRHPFGRAWLEFYTFGKDFYVSFGKKNTLLSRQLLDLLKSMKETDEEFKTHYKILGEKFQGEIKSYNASIKNNKEILENIAPNFKQGKKIRETAKQDLEGAKKKLKNLKINKANLEKMTQAHDLELDNLEAKIQEALSLTGKVKAHNLSIGNDPLDQGCLTYLLNHK